MPSSAHGGWILCIFNIVQPLPPSFSLSITVIPQIWWISQTNNTGVFFQHVMFIGCVSKMHCVCVRACVCVCVFFQVRCAGRISTRICTLEPQLSDRVRIRTPGTNSTRWRATNCEWTEPCLTQDMTSMCLSSFCHQHTCTRTMMWSDHSSVSLNLHSCMWSCRGLCAFTPSFAVCVVD